MLQASTLFHLRQDVHLLFHGIFITGQRKLASNITFLTELFWMHKTSTYICFVGFGKWHPSIVFRQLLPLDSNLTFLPCLPFMMDQ